MNAKQILTKLHKIRDDLREAENELRYIHTETNTDRIIFTAARQGVQAAEAELHSAVFTLESMADLTDGK